MSRKTNDKKMIVFVGGPMNRYMDNRYHELHPAMTFVYFPVKEDKSNKQMVKYTFAHFQDDTYYYEFCDAHAVVDDDEDYEEEF
jgi:hypothetical protein